MEDFETLSALTAGSDAIWQSSTFAVVKEMIAGVLDELPRAPNAQPREANIVMYTLERRTQSPGALILKQAFRQRIRMLAEMQPPKVG